MYRGDYNFFDYKYNIDGYNGQDFGGFAQYFYLALSFILIVILLIILRKTSREKILKIIRFTSIFLIVFYICKTSWETYYDIKYTGSFNYYLLPFDMCSFVMLSGVISGFTKGKIKEYSDAWLCSGCIVGGLANMVILNAFKYYPFLSFGAFYSMIWHFLMVMLGLLLITSKYVQMNYKTIIKGFIFHLCISLIVIPIDYIFNFDFMMYKDLGSIPIFEGVATNLTNNNIGFLNPLLMLMLYFISFNLIYLVYFIISKFRRKHE